MQLQQNDAAGGAGSIAQGLLGIAVNGLSRGIDGYLSKKYPLTSFNETLTYDSQGNLRPGSAPQRDITATESLSDFLSNPLTKAVGLSLGIGLLIFVAVKIAR